MHTYDTPKTIATQNENKSKGKAVAAVPVLQKKANNTGLPDNLKAGIENLSGFNMDDVKVHYNSDKPALLQAHAYAQGTDIHLASGQEKHLPHEAWHVVQQKQGRVKPTMQMKGKVNVNDDAGLENEADVMGAKAIQEKGKDNLNQNTINCGVAQLQIKSTAVIQLTINLNDAEEVKPGPPPTFKYNNYFYKVFNTRESAVRMDVEWDKADQVGVLTPAHKFVEVTKGNRTLWAFRSKGVEGTFFQFSKPGHKNNLMAWIAIQTNRILLKRLEKIFHYVRYNIGDGQGFFVNSDGGEIWFIDINNGGTTPDAMDVVAAIGTKLGPEISAAE